MLVVLGIAGVSAMAWYIFVGHNWNEAASNIDDRIGTMDGYTVVLFEGTRMFEYDPADEVLPKSQDASSASAPSAQSDQPESGDDAEAANHEVVELDGDDAVLDGLVPDSSEPITVAQAVESYLDKEAQTVNVDVTDLRAYDDPVIVSRNGQRMAIFHASGPRPDFAARTMTKQLADADIDVYVCLIDDSKAVERGLGHVNIAICTDPLTSLRGHHVGRTYVVGVPYEGEVGAVLIAPSGFVSSKVLSSL